MKRYLSLFVLLALPVVAAAAKQPTTARVPAVRPMAAETLHVVLKEWSVRPAHRTVRAGTIVFHVMNNGKQTHAFEVEGRGVEKRTEDIAPGGTAVVEVDLKAGRYQLYCPLKEKRATHRALGMHTRLTVRK